jgi:hypothetical protein
MLDADAIVAGHPYFLDDQPVKYAGKRPVMLDEITAPDMLHVIDPRDLPHRDYAPLLKYVQYVETRDNIMKFYVPSPTLINKWNCYIQFVEWRQQVNDPGLTAVEAARLLYWSGNIRIWCGCPSFLFWGYAYILTALDASMVPETRYPHIRNPELKGIACKHLRRCLKTLGFHLGDMAKAINQQRGR